MFPVTFAPGFPVLSSPTQQMSHVPDPVRHIMVAAFAIGILTLSSDVTAESPTDTPFGDFPRLETEKSDTPVFQSDDPDVWETPEAQAEPDGPVELRLDPTEPVSYEVVSQMMLGFEHREHFQPEYRSGLVVEYRPISQRQRDRLPSWRPDETASTTEGTPIIATVTDYSALFEHPTGLDNPDWMHSLLREATFSFRLTARGTVGDLRVHPPTNPLVRASIEDLTRLISQTQPPLPDQPVEPGDSWSDTVTVEVADGETDRHSGTDIEYTFQRWQRCPSGYCAVIEVDYQLEADGRLQPVHLHTETEAAGEARALLVFDPHKGRIVASHTDSDIRGRSTTTRPDEDEPTRDYEFEFSVQTSQRLLDR